MAQVLSYMEVDGSNTLPVQTRNRVTRSYVRVPITYSESSGSGEKEFIVQNVTSESSVRNLVISTLESPTNTEGGVLAQDWSWFDPAINDWTGWAATAVIPRLDPGNFIRIRTRMTAGEGAEPRPHFGVAAADYDEIIVS